MTRKRNSEAGITLIEMLVVVTIIALFAALVAPTMLKQGDKARVTQAHAQINSFMTAGRVQAGHGNFSERRKTAHPCPRIPRITLN